MGKLGIKLDVVSYSAAFSACEKGGQWEQSMQLFGEMDN
jgi:pentatricopeptide repeat protein